MAGQKQVIDMKAGKRMSVAQSNEHLRVGADSAKAAKVAGTYDETRTHLNFEIGKGGVVKEVDKSTSIPKRIRAILDSHNITDPNIGLSDEKLAQKRVGVRTHCNIIFEGSRETMRKLAFGDQKVTFVTLLRGNMVRKTLRHLWYIWMRVCHTFIAHWFP